MTQTSPLMVPITNGVVRSFGHVRANFAGLDLTGGIVSLSRSRKREREMAYSNNPDPIGKTLGENHYAASIEVYFDWWANMLATVQRIAPGYGDQPFTIFCSYVGANLVVLTDQILNCTFDTTEADDKQGIKALTRKIDLNPTKILFNGIDDLADPLVAAPQ